MKDSRAFFKNNLTFPTFYQYVQLNTTQIKLARALSNKHIVTNMLELYKERLSLDQLELFNLTYAWINNNTDFNKELKEARKNYSKFENDFRLFVFTISLLQVQGTKKITLNYFYANNETLAKTLLKMKMLEGLNYYYLLVKLNESMNKGKLPYYMATTENLDKDIVRYMGEQESLARELIEICKLGNIKFIDFTKFDTETEINQFLSLIKVLIKNTPELATAFNNIYYIKWFSTEKYIDRENASLNELISIFPNIEKISFPGSRLPIELHQKQPLTKTLQYLKLGSIFMMDKEGQKEITDSLPSTKVQFSN